MTAQPTIEGLLDSFRTGAWLEQVGLPQATEARAKADAVNAERARQDRETAYAYRAIFSSPQGRMVLEHLLDKTLRRTTWDGNRGLLDAVGYGFMREGQNQIVAMIFEMIEKGAEPPETVPDA